MKLRLIAALGVAALLLASCARDKPFAPGPHLTLMQADQLPPPDSASGPFQVGAFDKLAISVYGLPELSQNVQVDAAGGMALPLVGSISAIGKTPDQIAELIRERLSHYVRDPQVSVNVDETVSQVITVDGQVAEPGSYPVTGKTTLLRVVAGAKGTTEFAKLEDVVVFRTVGNKKMAALYNLGAIRRGMYPDPRLYADDVVVVGDSPSRRMFKDILLALPLITTPLIVLVQSGVI